MRRFTFQSFRLLAASLLYWHVTLQDVLRAENIPAGGAGSVAGEKSAPTSGGEVDYLRGLLQAAESGDVSSIGDRLRNISSLQEDRRQITGTVLVDAFQRADASKFRAFYKDNWGTMDPGLQASCLESVVTQDARAALDWVFSEVVFESSRSALLWIVSSTEPAIAAEYLEKISDGEERKRLADRIAVTWLARDDVSAMKWIQSHLALVDLREVLPSILANQTPDIRGAGLKILASIPAEELGSDARRAIASSLAGTEPDKALQMVERMGKAEGGDIRRTILDRYLALGSAKASEVLQILGTEELPAVDVIKEVLAEWTIREPAAARAWAERLEDQETRSQAVLRVNSMICMLDPEEGIRQALEAPQGKLREQLISNVGKYLCGRDLRKGFEWLNSQPDSSGKSLAFRYAASLAHRRDPTKLVTVAEEMLKGDAKYEFLSGVGETWASRDPGSAFAWYAGLTDEQREGRSIPMAQYLVQSDPEKAAQFVLSKNTSDADRTELLFQLGKQFGRLDPEMLEGVFRLMQEQSVPISVDMLSVRTLGKVYPEFALELAAESNAHLMKYASSGVYTDWARSNPEAALAYAAALQEPRESHAPPYFDMAKIWAQKDASALAAWVAEQPPSKGRDSAEYALAEVLSEASPDEAFGKLQKLQRSDGSDQSQIRYGLMSAIVRKVGFFDPLRAQSLIDGVGLDEKMREVLSSQIGKPDPPKRLGMP